MQKKKKRYFWKFFEKRRKIFRPSKKKQKKSKFNKGVENVILVVKNWTFSSVSGNQICVTEQLRQS